MTRVLVVDDEPDILAIVEGVLMADGHQVVVTEDPRNTMGLVIKHQIEVIVLDVNMPGFSGYDTLAALRSNPQTAGVPILFLSALGSSEHKIRGLRQGADDYLAKPFSGDELVLRVEILAARGGRSVTTSCSRAEDLDTAFQKNDFHSKSIYLGRYQAVGILGRGGMGIVLRGWDPTLKRPVALKTVRLDKLSGGPSSANRFVSQLTQEATALARFNHPNIVGVHDAGIGQDVAFLVMELVEGVSLASVLPRELLTLEQTAAVGIAVARALTATHAHEITHRDIKPGNVLLSYEGAIKVTDFGIADTLGSLSATNKIFGTPGYVPPELFLGESFEAPGDIFALGAVLYWCLTGHQAFCGESLPRIMASNVAAEPVPPSAAREGVPPQLNDLIMAMLHKEPPARPTALEVEKRLEKLMLKPPTWDAARLRGCAESAVEPNSSFSATLISLDPTPL